MRLQWRQPMKISRLNSIQFLCQFIGVIWLRWREEWPRRTTSVCEQRERDVWSNSTNGWTCRWFIVEIRELWNMGRKNFVLRQLHWLGSFSIRSRIYWVLCLAVEISSCGLFGFSLSPGNAPTNVYLFELECRYSGLSIGKKMMKTIEGGIPLFSSRQKNIEITVMTVLLHILGEISYDAENVDTLSNSPATNGDGFGQDIVGEIPHVTLNDDLYFSWFTEQFEWK